jgi:hypothetical protein
MQKAASKGGSAGHLSLNVRGLFFSGFLAHLPFDQRWADAAVIGESHASPLEGANHSSQIRAYGAPRPAFEIIDGRAGDPGCFRQRLLIPIQQRTRGAT